MGEVLFADQDVTVHVLPAPGVGPEKDQFGRELWPTSSRVLRPGESVSADEVPPYLLDAVKAGKVAGLSLVSEAKAEELLEYASTLRGLLAQPAEYQGASGWDNSHSDHLVADSVRVANLRAQAENAEVSGEPSDEPSGVAPKAAEEAAASESDAGATGGEADKLAADKAAEGGLGDVPGTSASPDSGDAS